MSTLRTSAAGLVLGLALATSAAPAYADKADHPEQQPCAKEQAQYDKASAKLAKLTEKWQQNPTPENKKAKKAQQQRTNRAQDRLEECQAEQA